MDLTLEQYGFVGLLWKYFANWLNKKRHAPAGLPTRDQLWRAVPNQRRYFHQLSVLAFCKPGYGGASRILAETFATAPELTCEALLFLCAYANRLKESDAHSIAIKPSGEEKISAQERDIRRRIREGHEDFVARTRP